MSAENGIGTAERLHAVDEPPKEPKGQRLHWPKGIIPFPRIKKGPETAQNRPDWQGILSTLGEISGIGAIAAGFGWYSPGLGLIAGGVGMLALSVVAGIPQLPTGKSKPQ